MHFLLIVFPNRFNPFWSIISWNLFDIIMVTFQSIWGINISPEGVNVDHWLTFVQFLHFLLTMSLSQKKIKHFLSLIYKTNISGGHIYPEKNSQFVSLRLPLDLISFVISLHFNERAGLWIERKPRRGPSVSIFNVG